MKIFGLIFAFVAVALVAYFFGQKGAEPETFIPNTPTSTRDVSGEIEPSDTESSTDGKSVLERSFRESAADPYDGWVKETNTAYGYAFRYPASLTRDPKNSAKLMFSEENLREGGGSVHEATLSEEVTLGKCKSDEALYDSSNTPEAVEKNGITFTRTTHSGRTTGQRYEVVTYQTYKDGLCFKLSLLILSASPVAGEDTSAIETANIGVKEEVSAVFEKIVDDFRFL